SSTCFSSAWTRASKFFGDRAIGFCWHPGKGRTSRSCGGLRKHYASTGEENQSFTLYIPSKYTPENRPRRISRIHGGMIQISIDAGGTFTDSRLTGSDSRGH
ncbi:MAG: hypothetical protein V3U53_08235, partial [bacterium]